MVFRLSLKQEETTNSILAVFHQIGFLNVSGRLVADQRCVGRREVATELAQVANRHIPPFLVAPSRESTMPTNLFETMPISVLA